MYFFGVVLEYMMRETNLSRSVEDPILFFVSVSWTDFFMSIFMSNLRGMEREKNGFPKMSFYPLCMNF